MPNCVLAGGQGERKSFADGGSGNLSDDRAGGRGDFSGRAGKVRPPGPSLMGYWGNSALPIIQHLGLGTIVFFQTHNQTLNFLFG